MASESALSVGGLTQNGLLIQDTGRDEPSGAGLASRGVSTSGRLPGNGVNGEANGTVPSVPSELRWANPVNDPGGEDIAKNLQVQFGYTVKERSAQVWKVRREVRFRTDLSE